MRSAFHHSAYKSCVRNAYVTGKKEGRMTDEPRAQDVPVKETQDAPMPSADQKTTDDKPVEGETKAPQEEGELPEGVKERTAEQFDRLRKELREEREKREAAERMFKSIQPKQPKTELKPLIDPETGLYNPQAQDERDRLLMEARERANRAEAAAQNYVVDQEKKELYGSHPELNPEGEKFNEGLSHLVASAKLQSMLHPEEFGGKQLSGKEAADWVKNEIKKQAGPMAQETIDQETPKEQASLEASGTAGRRTQVAPKLDELRQMSRKTNEQGLNAIVERLKSIPDKS